MFEILNNDTDYWFFIFTIHLLQYVTMEPMGIIVACHVGNAWIQRNVAMSMEHVWMVAPVAMEVLNALTVCYFK